MTTLKSKCERTTIHCTADVENVQVLMKVILSCDELCMFLLVGPDPRRSARTLLRSDGEGSHRVGNGDFTTATALTHLLPSTGTTINGEKIPEVVEKVSKHAGCTNAAKIGQFSRTRPQNYSFWNGSSVVLSPEVKRTVGWLPLWVQTKQADRCAQV